MNREMYSFTTISMSSATLCMDYHTKFTSTIFGSQKNMQKINAHSYIQGVISLQNVWIKVGNLYLASIDLAYHHGVVCALVGNYTHYCSALQFTLTIINSALVAGVRKKKKKKRKKKSEMSLTKTSPNLYSYKFFFSKSILVWLDPQIYTEFMLVRGIYLARTNIDSFIFFFKTSVWQDSQNMLDFYPWT